MKPLQLAKKLLAQSTAPPVNFDCKCKSRDSAVDTGRNSQAVLQAVDVQLICIARHLVWFLLLDCLAHWKQNQTLNWFSQCTKFERYGTVFDMNATHELTAQIAKMFALLNLCHVSSEKCSQNKRQTKFRLRSALFSSHLYSGCPEKKKLTKANRT